MDESKLVYRLDSEHQLSHVEPRNILREDFVFDQHSHQITTRQELHQHVQERRILERGVQLDKPRTVGVGQDVPLGTHVGELIFLELQSSG